jgi:CelD/BcsL family acetyltransferase involved in cellulose biosynthesis
MKEIANLAKDGFERGLVRPQTAVASSTRIIDRLDELDRLSAVWDAVGAVGASPMQHFIWARACAETFSSDYGLRVLTIGPVHRPAAIAPLVRRHGALAQLEMLGVNELYEPMDLCYDSPAALAALAEALVDLGVPLILKRLPAQSPAIPAIESAFKGRGLVFRQLMNSCPYIELDEDWKEPEQKFNSGRRSDFRRMQRHAEKLGAVTYEILTPAQDELGRLVEEAFRVEAASWKGEEGTALARDGVRGDFYRRYALAACEQGILRLCFMRIGGQAAAMQFAVECGGRFWLLKIGYDESFARCSPGMLLMLHTVRYAAERGLRSYEFLGTAAPWTTVWTDLERPCVALLAYPIGVRGLAALAADAATYAWPKAKKAWRGRR